MARHEVDATEARAKKDWQEYDGKTMEDRLMFQLVDVNEALPV